MSKNRELAEYIASKIINEDRLEELLTEENKSYFFDDVFKEVFEKTSDILEEKFNKEKVNSLKNQWEK